MGPGDIKQKIDERGANSNLSCTPALRGVRGGAGGRGQSGRCELVAPSPSPDAFSRIHAPGPRPGGGTATLAPRSPPTLRRISGGISASFHAPWLALRSGEPSIPVLFARRARDPGVSPAMGSPLAQSSPPPLCGACSGSAGEDPGRPTPTASKWEKRTSEHAGRAWGRGWLPAALPWP